MFLARNLDRVLLGTYWCRCLPVYYYIVFCVFLLRGWIAVEGNREFPRISYAPCFCFCVVSSSWLVGWLVGFYGIWNLYFYTLLENNDLTGTIPSEIAFLNNCYQLHLGTSKQTSKNNKGKTRTMFKWIRGQDKEKNIFGSCLKLFCLRRFVSLFLINCGLSRLSPLAVATSVPIGIMYFHFWRIYIFLRILNPVPCPSILPFLFVPPQPKKYLKKVATDSRGPCHNR